LDAVLKQISIKLINDISTYKHEAIKLYRTRVNHVVSASKRAPLNCSADTVFGRVACGTNATKLHEDSQCTYNVTLSRVRATTAAAEKQ